MKNDELIIQNKNMKALGDALIKAAEKQRSEEAQRRVVSHIKNIADRRDQAQAGKQVLEREISFHEAQLAAIKAGEFILSEYSLIFNDVKLQALDNNWSIG